MVEKSRYLIKEKWRVMYQFEYHETTAVNLGKVKKYIKSWIESWKENAKEIDAKVTLAKTDFRTFAKVHILDNKRETSVLPPCKDTFNLEVIDTYEKPRKIHSLV